jgi:hypothetical protein
LSLATCKISTDIGAQPRDIDPKQPPPLFLAIGSKGNNIKLLAILELSDIFMRARKLYNNLDGLKAEYSKSMPEVTIVSLEEASTYDLHLKQDDIEGIEQKINNIFGKYKYQKVCIKILENDARRNKEKIFIEKLSDEYSYKYVYEIQNNKIIPLLYGELTKAKIFKGIVFAVATFVVGIVFYLTVKRKQKDLLNPILKE